MVSMQSGLTFMPAFATRQGGLLSMHRMTLMRACWGEEVREGAESSAAQEADEPTRAHDTYAEDENTHEKLL
ncbi:hypothetical protein Ptr902_05092 [Pyrenophora tritici-repentis]|nr:hypothetical protein Ptr902_05092 [Pyrenophora tritici-repentis]